jgi:hypothetical protein
VRELVAKGLGGIPRIGANQDRPAPGKCHAGPPRWRAPPAEFPHARLIRDYDEAKRPRIAHAQARPVERAVGVFGERECKWKLAGPGDGGDLSDLNRPRFALKGEDEEG